MSETLGCTLRGLSAVGVLIMPIVALHPGRPAAQAPSDSARPDSARALNPLNALDPATLDAFKARPLFSSTRRPPPPLPQVFIPPPPAAAIAQAPDLRLIGVVSGVDRAVAILRRPTGGPSLSLKVGDTVESWRVQTIAPDRVILREGDREQIYRLFAGNGAANTPSPNRLSPGAPPARPGFP